MKTLLSQDDFAKYAAKWATFLAKAKPKKLQKLFQKDDGSAQLFVSFDLPTVIIPLLSTVGIAMVRTRFVRLPAGPADAPRFGVAVYAADSQGGRISAYYLGTSQWLDMGPQLKSCDVMPKLPAGHTGGDIYTGTDSTGTDDGASGGIVPFNLAKGWICDWCWAVSEQRLDPAMFATSYGWLLGYDFQLDDFLDPLFSMNNPQFSTVRAVFGLKRYYPAYPENLDQPTYTFELVIRPYSPAYDNGDLSSKLPRGQRTGDPDAPGQEPSYKPAAGGGGGGDPSLDQSTTYPPGPPVS